MKRVAQLVWLLVAIVGHAQPFFFAQQGAILSAGFNPADYGTVVVVHDARDLVGSDGSALSAWNAQVGSPNLAQGTGANQPTLQTAETPTGQNAVQFDGTNDSMDGTLGSSLTSGATMIAVVKFNVLSTFHPVVRIVSGSPYLDNCGLQWSSGPSRLQGFWSNTAGGFTTANESGFSDTSDWHVIAVRVAANVETYRDGASVGGPTAFSGTIADVNGTPLYAGTDSVGNYLNGLIAYHVLYDGDIGDANTLAAMAALTGIFITP